MPDPIVALAGHGALQHGPGQPDALDNFYAAVAPFGGYMPVVLAPEPTGTDDTALQAWLDTSTSSTPVWLLNPWNTPHTLTGTGLVMPFAPGTRISGANNHTSKIVQTSENPILRFTTTDTHTITVENMGFAYSTLVDATKTARTVFTYEGAGSQSYYHHLYKNLYIENAYRGFYVTGTATLWDTTFEQVRFQSLQHSAYDMSNLTVGCPRITFRDLTIINVVGVVTANGAAIITGSTGGASAVLKIDGFDIEGWNGPILQAYGTYPTDISHVHIEHHTMSTTDTKLFVYDGGAGQTHWLRQVCIESITFPAGGATDIHFAWAGFTGTFAGKCRLRIEGVKVNTITNTAGVTKFNIVLLAGATTATSNQTAYVGNVSDLSGLGIVKNPADTSKTTTLECTDLEPGVPNSNIGVSNGALSGGTRPDGGSPVSAQQYVNRTCRPVMVVIANMAGVTDIVVGPAGAAGTDLFTLPSVVPVPRGYGIKTTWATTQPTTEWWMI